MKPIGDRFQIGMRVRLSSEGLDALGGNPRFNKTLRGIVMGYGRGGENTIRVQRRGLKSIDSFHADFWRKD